MRGFQGAATHCNKTEPLFPWCGLRTGNRAALKPGAWDRDGFHVLVSSSRLLLSLARDREQGLVLTQLLKYSCSSVTSFLEWTGPLSQQGQHKQTVPWAAPEDGQPGEQDPRC